MSRFQTLKGMSLQTFNELLIVEGPCSISDHMYRMAVLSMLCDDGTLDVSKSVERPFKILTESTTTDSSILDAL